MNNGVYCVQTESVISLPCVSDSLNEWELQDIVGRFCCEKGHQTTFENTAASSLIHVINFVMTE
jgi:hypothetical protein